MDKRTEDRVLREPGNKWAYYELAKAIEATDILELIVIAQGLGLFTSNREAISDGYAEYLGSKHNIQP